MQKIIFNQGSSLLLKSVNIAYQQEQRTKSPHIDGSKWLGNINLDERNIPAGFPAISTSKYTLWVISFNSSLESFAYE